MSAKKIGSAVSVSELIQWTMDMVRIPSYCGVPEQELGVAEYLKALFEREDIECRIDKLCDGRANIYAVLRGSGGGKSLMFNGHLDTVPPYDMPRACDPYLDNGMIRGRGTSDMKGPLAAMAGAMIALRRSGITLSGDVLFAGVADEEQRSIGCCDLIDCGIRADAVIVGEPLGVDRIAIAQKGLEWFEFQFCGRTVHGGSQDRGINAIEKAVDFINAINRDLRPQLDMRTHPLLGRSTVNIGVIRGGTQLSTVAGACSVLLDRRFLPDQETYEGMCHELNEILRRLSEADPDFRCKMRVTEDSVMAPGYVHQGMEQDPNDPFIACLADSLRQEIGHEAVLTGCPCWTDAGLLSHYGNMVSVVYGPGSLACSHSSDEHIRPEDMLACMHVYADVAASFCK